MLRDMAIRSTNEVVTNGLHDLGLVANQVASATVFEDYKSRKSTNTLRRHAAVLAKFTEYITGKGVDIGDLWTDPNAWTGITWGLVGGFVRWSLGKGYSVNTVNARLSTIKTFAKLAFKAGTIDHQAYALIKAVEGYSHSDGKNVDQQRANSGIPTNLGYKKQAPIVLSSDQAQLLKDQPDTPKGRRDRLLMCLLLDHGLRISEVAELERSNFIMVTQILLFYRPKTKSHDKHQMSADTYAAAQAYLDNDAPEAGSIWLKSYKSHAHLEGVMSETSRIRSLTKLVGRLGQRIGIVGLSPHDCRHYLATKMARHGTPAHELIGVFGWSSISTSLRYIRQVEVKKVD